MDFKTYVSNLNSDLRILKGVGEKKSALFAKLGIYTIWDLLYTFPRDYEDRTSFFTIHSAPKDSLCCIKAKILRKPIEKRIKKNISLYILRASDETGTISVKWFSSPFNRSKMQIAEEYVFFGRIMSDGAGREMELRVMEPCGKNINTGCIVPSYALTAGLTQNDFRKAVKGAFETVGNMIETMPPKVLKANGLMDKDSALRIMHMPGEFESLKNARKRLAFEELFTLLLALAKIRNNNETRTEVILKNVKCAYDFAQSLNFTLTDDQKKAVNDICSDFLSGRPMNRLLQGDVGSGKTVVAASAAYVMAKNGYQTAFMAPTEVLANQHYEVLVDFYKNTDINVGLLTGSSKGKKEILKNIESGFYDVVIGTHALIEERVSFRRLGLCITDEQHRFGVKQRAMLAHGEKYPHVLVMSATPIPRTLSLILYGDLDVSVIASLPKGRQPVDTFWVNDTMHDRIYKFIEKQISAGRQCFVICPLVEDSDKLELKSSTKEYEKLCRIFGRERVCLVHGKMSAAEKDSVMEAFREKKADILVATTVIEVGIDIPNANLIVIENAERFGLSQLHQLRGRVGRGSEKSYCILVSDGTTDDCRERMKIMCNTNDGFKISQKDLEMRGCGEFFGTRQHGLPELKVANLFTDMDIVRDVKIACDKIIADDPELKSDSMRFIKARIEKIFSQCGNIEIFN